LFAVAEHVTRFVGFVYDLYMQQASLKCTQFNWDSCTKCRNSNSYAVKQHL